MNRRDAHIVSVILSPAFDAAIRIVRPLYCPVRDGQAVAHHVPPYIILSSAVRNDTLSGLIFITIELQSGTSCTKWKVAESYTRLVMSKWRRHSSGSRVYLAFAYAGCAHF